MNLSIKTYLTWVFDIFFLPLKNKKSTSGSLIEQHLRKTDVHCGIILLLTSPWGCR